jgi:hypothetical protein
MAQDLELIRCRETQKRIKRMAIGGAVLLTAGVLSTLVTWGYFHQIWFATPLAAILGAFTLLFALVAKGTKLA